LDRARTEPPRTWPALAAAFDARIPTDETGRVSRGGARRRTPASGVAPGYVAPVGPAQPGDTFASWVAPRDWDRIVERLQDAEDEQLEAIMRRLDGKGDPPTPEELRQMVVKVRAADRDLRRVVARLKERIDRMATARAVLVREGEQVERAR